jgi:hypothetical protein
MKTEDVIEQKARELEGRLINPPRRLPQYAQRELAARVEALRWVLGERDDDPILGSQEG